MILHIRFLNISLSYFLTQGVCGLKNLRILDIAGNIIRTFPSGVSRAYFYYN